MTIHEGIATMESGEQSKSIAFFASLSEEQRLDILEAARLGLGDGEILDRMDMGDEHAALLENKIEEFMK